MMQPLHRVFLALLLGHLMADFPFQSTWIANRKGRHAFATVLHAAIHCASIFLAMLIFAREVPAWIAAASAVGLSVVHAAQDICKQRLCRYRSVGRLGTTIFFVDQALHVAVLAVVAALLAGVGPAAAFRSLTLSLAVRDRILLVAVVYCGFIFGGGYLIRFVTRSLATQAAGPLTESSEDLRNAGLYIGWLERCLVLTAICMQSPAMVGLILTGKSIARFPELKDAKFAEYFLIGTFLSMGLAIAGGLLLLYYFHGTVSFK